MDETKVLEKGVDASEEKNTDSVDIKALARLPTLWEIAQAHHGKLSDKWSAYYDVYDAIFSEYRHKPVSILEIGIQNGGFLEILANYFKMAKAIVGCDVDERCGNIKFDDKRIKIVIGDIKDHKTITNIINLSNNYDIIIDDGSHTHEDIIKAFLLLFPYVKDGGVYIIEDLHASYWKSYDGGVFKPITAMNFFKRLLDVVNYEAWGVGIPRKEVLKPFLQHFNMDIDEFDLAHIRSIEFYNSLCIIRKDNPEKAYLGKRFIAGSYETVTQGFFKLKGSQLRDLSNLMQVNFDRENDPIILFKLVEEKDKKIQSLSSQLEAIKAEKGELEKALAERDREVNELIAQLEEKDRLYEEALGQLEAIRSERDNLQQSLVQREKEVQYLNGVVVAKEEEIQSLSSQLEAIRSERDRLSEELFQKQNEIERLNGVVTSIGEEIRSLSSQLEAIKIEKEKLEKVLAERDGKVNELIAQLEEKNKLYTEALGQLEAIRSERDNLQQSLVQKEKEVEYLNNVVVAKEEEIQDLSSQLEAVRSERDRLSEALAQKDKEVSDLIAQLEEKNKLYEDIKRENERLKSDLEEKNQLIDRLSREKGELVITLMELKKTWYWRFLIKPLIRFQKIFKK